MPQAQFSSRPGEASPASPFRLDPVEQLEALGDLIVALTETRSVGKLLSQLGRHLTSLLHPASIQVWLLDDTKREMHLVLLKVEHEHELAARLAEHKIEDVATSPFTSAEAVRRREVVVRRYGKDAPPRVAEIMAAGRIQMSVSVPIQASGEIHGVLNMMFRESRELSKDDCRFFETLGRTVAAAIESARLLESVTRERRWLHRVLDELPVAVVIAEGEEGRLTRANKAFERLLGPLREMDLRAYPELFDVRSVETGELYTWDDLPLTRALLDGEEATAEYLITTRDGVRRRILSQAAPLNDPLRHAPAAIVALQDITSQRQLEREKARQDRLLRFTFENVPAGIALLDAVDERYVQVNENFARFFQHPKATVDRIAGRRISDLYAQFETSGLAEIFRRVRRTGVPFSASAYPFDGFARGRTFWNVSLVPIDENGEVEKLLFFALEVTNLVEAEQRMRWALERAEEAGVSLQQVNRDLVEAVRVKDEFLSTLSHELRTPLTPILGWTRILKAHGEEPSLLDQGLRAIERNVLAQVRLVDDLLDLSRLAYDRVRLNLEPIELSAFLLETWEVVRLDAEARGIALVAQPASEPVMVQGDRLRLKQVLTQLLKNAVKFSEDGGEVLLATRRVGDVAEVEVTDRGVGIPSEFLGRVFDRFQQADATTTRRHGGLGIGLSIAKQLTEMHGGSIAVESEGPGRGSRFVLRLAAAPAASENGARASAAPEGVTGLRVLLADDDADTLEALQRLLELQGAQVITAANGLDAIDQALEHVPDVLLCDLQMPDLSGYEVAARLRATAETAQVHLIALTGHGTQVDIDRTQSAGFEEHLLKPVAPEQLVSTIVGVVRRGAGEAG